MKKRPGGEISARPLHFIWMADCSGSMGADGKIQSLNSAIRDVIPLMKTTAKENPNANILVRALKFSCEVQWNISNPTPSSLKAFQSLSSLLILIFSSTGALITMSTKLSIALNIAVPKAPDDESTCWRAGQNFSMSLIEPSAPNTGSFRATFLISETASLIR